MEKSPNVPMNRTCELTLFRLYATALSIGAEVFARAGEPIEREVEDLAASTAAVRARLPAFASLG